MLKKMTDDYKKYIDALLRQPNGKLRAVVYIPIPPLARTRDLQRAVHRYAGSGRVTTYENTNHELVVQRKQGITFPSLNLKPADKSFGFIAQEVPFVFKVCDKGILANGQPYDVIGVLRNSDPQILRVDIQTTKGWWMRNQERRLDGRLVMKSNYHRSAEYYEKFRLMPPTCNDRTDPSEQQTIQSRFVHFMNELGALGVYEHAGVWHPSQDDLRAAFRKALSI